MNKTIFLDRDGTLIEEKKYLSDIKDIQILKNTAIGLKKLKEAGYLLIIVSNQSGVARGYFSEQTVVDVNNYLKAELKKQGVYIDDIYYCPHYENGIVGKYSIKCNCRKPKIGMIESASRKHCIDLKNSYVIGDKDTDIALGINVGCKSILIDNNNYNKPSSGKYYLATDMLDAANYILKNIGEKNE